MTSIRYSASNFTSPGDTTITVDLGGVPSIGDLVVVLLSTSNEIVTRQPGYNTNLQWLQLQSVRCPHSTGNTLTAWVHTWSAADSGSTAVFTFVPAPSLGVGDKDLSSTSAMCVAYVLNGPACFVESFCQGIAEDQALTVTTPAQRKTAELAIAVGYAPASTVLSSTYGSQVSLYGPGFGSLSTWASLSPTVGTSATVNAAAASDLISCLLTFSSTPGFYIAPFLEEGPVAENSLFFRYRLDRHYTVLNNSGVFTAQRYLSTDQVSAATQIFVNNAPITLTDRTNILNAGIGGEFSANA